MNQLFRPLRAADTPDPLSELERLGHFPLLGSWKLDGIRGTIRLGKTMSRTMIPLPSGYAQQFAQDVWDGIDGELTPQVVPPNETLMSASYSAVMTHKSTTPLVFNVFDLVLPEAQIMKYSYRLERLRELIARDTLAERLGIVILEQRLLRNMEELLAMEQEAIDLGHEGLIVRRPDAPYKFGKSTLNQGYLIKVARYLRSEAVIIGFEEQMLNTNEAVIDPRGLTKRSKVGAGMTGKNTLGAFLVRDYHSGIEFKVGTGDGLDDSLRKEIWDHQDKYLGRIFRYRFKPYGVKDRPRHPVYEGWRDLMDI